MGGSASREVNIEPELIYCDAEGEPGTTSSTHLSLEQPCPLPDDSSATSVDPVCLHKDLTDSSGPNSLSSLKENDSIHPIAERTWSAMHTLARPR